MERFWFGDDVLDGEHGKNETVKAKANELQGATGQGIKSATVDYHITDNPRRAIGE